MKKVLGIAIFSLGIVACGGSSGEGSVSKGFYDLSLQVTPAYLVSPAVDDSTGEPVIPEDTLNVSLELFYSGAGNALSGYVKKATLCIEGSGCVNIPISGVIRAGQRIETQIRSNAHKYNVPWIVLNPYEDEIFQTERIRDTIQGGVQTSQYQDSYYNNQRRVVLPDYPLVPNSVTLTTEQGKTYTYSLTVPQYETTDGTVNLKLPKGTLSGNTIVANSVRIDAGSIVCVDDGAGNIVDEGGGTNCSGSINYNTGDLSFSILNINNPTDVVVSYDFTGQLNCYDDGNGKLLGDCTDSSSVNYQTAEIVYAFRYQAKSVPVNVTIDYSYYQGTTDGKTFTYLLPADTVDTQNPNKKYKYGREIVVYKNGAFACSLTESVQCEIVRNGRSVEIRFFNPQQNANLEIEYTKDTVYDFNPDIDAKAYNHLWNGSSTATVRGSVSVEVELEDGEKFSTSQDVTFEVVPKAGGVVQ